MNRRKFLAGSAVATASALTVTSRPTPAEASPLPMPAMPGAGTPTRQVATSSGFPFAFAPGETALVLIDMQKFFFLGPDGSYSPSLGPIVPRVQALKNYARKLGCMIVHTRESYAPDFSDVSEFRRSLGYVGQHTHIGRTLIRGEYGNEFIEELKPLPGELVVDKAAFNAFHGSSLDKDLRQAGISHLILCGVTTECCVHSTLRDAVDRGYWCLTAADCCGAYDKKLHDATIGLIGSSQNMFGWVANLDDIRKSTPLS